MEAESYNLTNKSIDEADVSHVLDDSIVEKLESSIPNYNPEDIKKELDTIE